MTSRRPGHDMSADNADDTASIVRMYALTDGRTRARHSLSLHTVLGPGRRTPPQLPDESLQIVALCQQRQRPLVELAGLLGLHVTAVAVLVSDLIDAGALSVPLPETPGAGSDLQILSAVSAGLRRKWPNAAKAG